MFELLTSQDEILVIAFWKWTLIWWTVITAPHELVRVQSGRGQWTQRGEGLRAPNRAALTEGGLKKGQSSSEMICPWERLHRKNSSSVVRHTWIEIQTSFVCLVAQSHLTLCNPMDCSTPDFPVLHCTHSLLKLMFTESVVPSYSLILCHPLLLLPLTFPSIRVFSSELALIRWPKYWSSSFSISPSNEYSELISFRMDWLDLLAV